MKDERKIRNNQLKYNYDERMREKGFIKACYWHAPYDSERMSNQARLSRKRHNKRSK